MIRAILIFIVCFCFPFCSASKIIKAGVDDSIYSAAAHSEKKQKNIIENMNQEELTSLIDSLFQMETIPSDMLDEVKTAIVKLRSKETNSAANSSSTIPSSELYSCWETNNLFPEKDMLKMKGDTSVTIVLKEEGQDDYFHPFNGTVTSDFGWRDSAQHNGIDIHLNRGDKISVAFDGMVRVARNSGGFGNVVIIRHYNGLETVYAHLSKIKVKPGQVVVAGQVIGLGGSTGISTGPHLHFEVRFKGVPINPKYLISFTDQKLLCNELVIKNSKWGLTAYPKDEKIYTIEKGDTLFGIAKHFGTSTKSIKEINGFTNGRIKLKAGQKINVMQ